MTEALKLAEAAGWRTEAAAWLRRKADQQEATNETYQKHAKCYTSWAERVRDLRWLADDLDAEDAASPFGLDRADPRFATTPTHSAAAVTPETWTEQQIADACVEAGISDSKFEGLMIALHAIAPADSGEQAEPDGVSRESWIANAERVYRACGDDEKTAQECARWIADQQDWLGDEVDDAYVAALDDIEGRPAAQPAREPLTEKEFLEQWLQFADEVVGVECCGHGRGDECCGNPEPVRRTPGEVIDTMATRHIELSGIATKEQAK